MKNIRVTNLGQIKEADINFGDLTLFVGPQATGKSILLQLIKLLLDSQDIVNNLNNNGYDWEENTDEFYELYFGDWRVRSSLSDILTKCLKALH